VSRVQGRYERFKVSVARVAGYRSQGYQIVGVGKCMSPWRECKMFSVRTVAEVGLRWEGACFTNLAPLRQAPPSASSITYPERIIDFHLKHHGGASILHARRATSVPILPLCPENILTQHAVAVGGTAGYLRTRSTPSLVAGIVLGASYGYAGTSIPNIPNVSTN
jgi:hypothetical protein